MVNPIKVHLNPELPAEEIKKHFLRLGAIEHEYHYTYAHELVPGINLLILIEEGNMVIYVNCVHANGSEIPYIPFYNEKYRDKESDVVIKRYNSVMYSLIEVGVMKEGE